MGCGCKDDFKEQEEFEPVKIVETYKKVLAFIFTVILFMILLPIAMAVVIPFTIVMLFRILFLNDGNVNVTESLFTVGEFFKKQGGQEEPEDEEIYHFENDQEYEIIGVDDLEVVK